MAHAARTRSAPDRSPRRAETWREKQRDKHGEKKQSDKKLSKKADPSRGAGKKKGSSGLLSTLVRVGKLMFLIFCFAVLGFFAVLVFDVGSKVVGQVRLGETRVVELWNRVVDRVFDRDLPRLQPPTTTTPAKKITSSKAPTQAPAPRAPKPAAKPEEDAKHVTTPPDPQVERARQRLNELMQRL